MKFSSCNSNVIILGNSINRKGEKAEQVYNRNNRCNFFSYVYDICLDL